MFRIFNTTNQNFLNFILTHTPDAIAYIKGNKFYPNINGKVEFYQTNAGVLVVSEIDNLKIENNKSNFYAMHIHNGEDCEQNPNGEFKDTSHYNPANNSHPNHAGDLPSLLSNNGFVFNVVLTDRFKVVDIMGKTVIIHSNPDDERTDPSGNSGSKIACGKIVRR